MVSLSQTGAQHSAWSEMNLTYYEIHDVATKTRQVRTL
jgi:hypothetical protein